MQQQNDRSRTGVWKAH